MGYTIVQLLFLHFLADFVLQPREMGKRKSESPRWLAAHLGIQFVVFFPFTGIWFALANCAVHGVVDWFIWRWYKQSVLIRNPMPPEVQGQSVPAATEAEEQDAWRRGLALTWRYWEDKLFYDTIGLDQLLHSATIVLLAEWIKP